MKKITNVIEKISKMADRIAGYVLLGVMALVVVNVILRTIFIKSVPGTIELVEIFAAVTGGLALAYCGFLNEHIEIDFIWAKFPKIIRFVTKLIVDLLSLGFILLAAWMLWKYGDSLRISGRVSPTLALAYYPFVYLIALGFFLYSLIMLIKIIDQLRGRAKI